MRVTAGIHIVAGDSSSGVNLEGYGTAAFDVVGKGVLKIDRRVRSGLSE
jgi:hypothetical protein